MGHVSSYIDIEYFVNVNHAIYIIWLHFRATKLHFRLIDTPVNIKWFDYAPFLEIFVLISVKLEQSASRKWKKE